ncbi:granzyme M-like [Brevipalpus obovatus]|uniref:granzyme M-like n=1 Tax=Brevipalpus obovatus TaxID=246614 RepID=UPI003D9F8CD9
MLSRRQENVKNFVLLCILVDTLLGLDKTCCFNFEEPDENSPPETDSSSEDGIPSPSHIIGGTKAGKHEFPYIVSVRLKINPKLPFGMGSIVTKPGSISEDSRWIITAGHIPGEIRNPSTNPKIITRKLVVFPKYDSNWRKLAKHRYYTVKNAYCHPWPKSEPFPVDDIALLELDSKIPLNKPNQNFKSIQIADKNFDVTANKRVTVAGWGLNQTKPPMIYDYLLKSDITIHSTSDCKKYYHNFVEIKWFCAGLHKNRKTKTICDGDSGAPGVSKTSGGDQILSGVVTGSNTLCTKPTTFMNVSHYRDWIEEVITTRPKKMLCKNLLKNRPA